MISQCSLEEFATYLRHLLLPDEVDVPSNLLCFDPTKLWLPGMGN